MQPALVFVSGASSGIGHALAHSVPFPARVIDLSRRGAKGLEHCKADLATPEGWDAAARCFEREIAAFRGEQVIFVHAAGTLAPIGFAGELDADDYRRNVLLNAAAPAVLGDAFLRALRGTRAEASILMISSGAARNVYEGWSAYCAGKAALDMWVRTTGAEQARRGSRCRVLAVAPGVVETPMQQEIRATAESDFPQVARFVTLHEERALPTPGEVAPRIWGLLGRDLANGAVVDLRDFENA